MGGRFKFKAWNKKKRLLTRPGTVAFVQGELVIPDCVILQFTGFYDMMKQEIYEEDVLLIGEQQYHVYWDAAAVTWCYRYGGQTKKLTREFAATTVRGYNAYEKKDEPAG